MVDCDEKPRETRLPYRKDMLRAPERCVNPGRRALMRRERDVGMVGEQQVQC